jgi:hypothetical protein
MSFDRRLLIELGGFDVALGAGTPVRSGEDGAMISHLMLAGHTVVYEPGAFVRHDHRSSWTELTTQFYGIGMGLTAFYTRLLLAEPRWLPFLVRLLPAALRERARDDSQCRAEDPDFPLELRRMQRRGMLAGPFAYLQSRRRQRRPIGQAANLERAAPWSRSR